MPTPEPTFPEPPMFDIWSTLMERWLDLPVTEQFADRRRKQGEPGGARTKASLVLLLNTELREHYTPQAVSQWATGTDSRNPPWRAVLFLLRDLDLDLVMSGAGKAWFVKARKK